MSDERLNPKMVKLPADIQAQNEWLKNVNSKLVVMIKNAADVLEGYVENLDQILEALRETHTIYSRLHSDLTEAFDEQQATTSNELSQSNSRDVPERGRESNISRCSHNPNPFGPGDSSS